MKKIDDCFCQIWGKSWPCKAAKTRHLKAHKNVKTIPSFEKYFTDVKDEFDTDEEIEDDTLHEDSTEAMPVIDNMESYMVSVYPFKECQDSIGIDD